MTRLVLLHGFTQTAESWSPLLDWFSPDLDVEAIDLPGHGSEAGNPASLADGADWIAQQCGHAVYVGYSMGARFLLNLAVRHPEVTNALVFLGATAGIDATEERAARVSADRVLADEVERDGLEVFLDRWMAHPMFTNVPDDRATRLHNTPAGLAESLRLAGTGTQDPPLWDDLGAIAVPTLVLAGDRDAKFTSLGQRLQRSIGDNATFTTIAGAGHAAHLEQPDAFVQVVERWLSAMPDRPRTASPREAGSSR